MRLLNKLGLFTSRQVDKFIKESHQVFHNHYDTSPDDEPIDDPDPLDDLSYE